MPVRLLVLGWDSATFDVIDPLLQAGRLSALKALIERGSRAPLRSTWPPMTDCAWTSAFTGVNPGRHGIFGSWYRAPGAYECRYFSARDRRAPALWELARDIRFLVWNVPMTYPPSPINGVMVAGYGAPPGATYCEPAGFQRELESRWDPADLLDRAPHGSLENFRDDLLRGLDTQARALAWAADRVEADVVVAVWPHIDRAQHFFWRFRDTEHELASTVDDVYVAADRATGALAEAFDEADVVVVSDHGAGDLRGDVNLGAWLVDHRFASYDGRGRWSTLRAAWRLPPGVRRAARRVAPRLAARAMKATLSGQLGDFDWANTQAFVGFHGDLWLNVTGREPQGIVDPDEAPGLGDEIAARLLELRDPRRDEPVFAAAHRRDDIYRGDAIELAPDLMLDSWSAGYRIAPNRAPGGPLVDKPHALSGVRESWSSDHRPVGVFAGAGPRLKKTSARELSLYDVCPTALALLGEPVPGSLDGRVADELIDEAFLEQHSIRWADAATPRASAPGEYSEEDAAAVAAHLRDLGYIE